MTLPRTRARLALAAGLVVSAATLPGHAAVTFTSAEVSVYALAFETFGHTHEEETTGDLATAPRQLLAEANASAIMFPPSAAAAISAIGDFSADGTTGILSAGFNLTAWGDIWMAFSEVRYAFLYRFDLTTPSIIQGDWTLSHPADLTIRLTGPSGLTLPLSDAFGSHRNTLAAGRYELSFSTVVDPTIGGYELYSPSGAFSSGGFDIYSFVIVDAPPVPEPGSWALMALGLGCGALRLRTSSGRARADRTPVSDPTTA